MMVVVMVLEYHKWQSGWCHNSYDSHTHEHHCQSSDTHLLLKTTAVCGHCHVSFTCYSHEQNYTTTVSTSPFSNNIDLFLNPLIIWGSICVMKHIYCIWSERFTVFRLCVCVCESALSDCDHLIVVIGHLDVPQLRCL